MITHKTKVHPETFYCNVCDYKSIKSGNVRKHNDTVHKGIRIDCNHCEKKFTQHRDLDRHLEKNHGIEIDKIFKCSKCDYTTKYKQILSLHEKNTHSGIVFKCDICGFISKTEFGLGSHKRTTHFEQHIGATSENNIIASASEEVRAKWRESKRRSKLREKQRKDMSDLNAKDEEQQKLLDSLSSDIN